MRSTMYALSTFALLALAACDETKASPDSGTGTPSPGTPDAGGGACVADPKTPEEILNQCPPPGTDSVVKKPDLPLLSPDGALPPLP